MFAPVRDREGEREGGSARESEFSSHSVCPSAAMRQNDGGGKSRATIAQILQGKAAVEGGFGGGVLDDADEHAVYSIDCFVHACRCEATVHDPAVH